MSAEVRPLFSVNALAPDPACKAEYLRSLADRVESGALMPFDYAVLVMSNTEGVVVVKPFGAQMDGAKCVGLLEYAKHQIMMSD